MKYTLLILIIIAFLLNPEPAQSQACTDPAGCSAVSYVIYPHTVGVIQFGNSSGRVLSKKTVNHCPEASCNNFFNMSTALLAPRTTSSVTKAARAEDVSVIVVRRVLASTQTSVFKNTLDLATDGFRQLPAPTKFSSFPFSMGFGNNAIAFLSLSGRRNRLVSQILNPTANTLTQTITNVPAFQNQLSSAINREGSLLMWVNRTNPQSVNVNSRELNPTTRRGVGAKVIDVLNYPITPTSRKTIASIAVSDLFELSASSLQKQDELDKFGLVILLTVIGDSDGETLDFVSARVIQNRTGGQVQTKQLGSLTRLVAPKRTLQTGAPFFQSVQVDPGGTYVVYADYSSACRKSILKFFRISRLTLRRIGPPKTLAGCADVSASPTGIFGLNVINLE